MARAPAEKLETCALWGNVVECPAAVLANNDEAREACDVCAKWRARGDGDDTIAGSLSRLMVHFGEDKKHNVHAAKIADHLVKELEKYQNGGQGQNGSSRGDAK